MVFGILMWAAAKYTIYTGNAKFAGKAWLERTFHIGFFFTPLFVVIMEFYRVFMNKKDINRKSSSAKITNEQKNIVERLRSGATSDELKADYPEKTILLFKHLIYDLTDYSHPGGDIIFVNHNFKEISRYVMGTHPDEHENFPAFIHSQSAYQVLDSHLIGSMIKAPVNMENNDSMLLTFEGPRLSDINSVELKYFENESEEDNGELLEKPKAVSLLKEIDDNWTLYNRNGTEKSVTENLWSVHNNSKVSKNLHVVQFRNSQY